MSRRSRAMLFQRRQCTAKARERGDGQSEARLSVGLGHDMLLGIHPYVHLYAEQCKGLVLLVL